MGSNLFYSAPLAPRGLIELVYIKIESFFASKNTKMNTNTKKKKQKETH